MSSLLQSLQRTDGIRRAYPLHRLVRASDDVAKIAHRIQVNHLSTSLIAFLLTPNLMRAAEVSGTPSRLVIVASLMHYWTSLGAEFDGGILKTLNGPGKGSPAAAAADKYSHSKCQFPSFH